MNFLLTEAWMFSGTIKKNILFGLDYDEQKFFQCISATALEEVSVVQLSFRFIECFCFYYNPYVDLGFKQFITWCQDNHWR